MDTVSREQALDVLRQFGVNVTQLDAEKYMLGMDGQVPQTHRLPEALGRKMVGYLADQYDIPVHLFWHPDQVTTWRAAKAAGSKQAEPN